MPRGIPGSGPYSKVNADGSPKDGKETSAATVKSGPKVTAKATRPKKATAKKATRRRSTTRRATTKVNGNGRGALDLGSFHTVSVGADGTLTLEGQHTVKVKLRPSALLDLEQDAKTAADAFLASR